MIATNRAYDFSTFDETMRFRGWCIIPEIITPTLIATLRKELISAVDHCQDLRMANSSGANASGTAHHLLEQGESFAELLKTFPALPYLYHLLGEYMVLNSYAGTQNPPTSLGYAHRVHRDIRYYARTPVMMINTLVLLEDFNENNGGTYLLPGSHLLEDKPSDAYFLENADQIVAPAGSILIFNSNIWHASGINASKVNRPAVSMTLTHPDIKPQYNFMSCLKMYHWENESYLRQLLGANNQTPSNLEQAYQPRPAKPVAVTNS